MAAERAVARAEVAAGEGAGGGATRGGVNGGAWYVRAPMNPALVCIPTYNERENVEAICRGLDIAVDMPPDERRRRMRALDRRVATRDLAWWTRTFLARLAAAGPPAASAA